VAGAAVIGFAGNELVARYRIRVGRHIGSAALVADGLHARTDGFTSLAVLLGAGGVALGWRQADPIIGLVITVAILGALRSAVGQVGARLMDAVDPGLVEQATGAISTVEGVRDVRKLRIRWPHPARRSRHHRRPCPHRQPGPRPLPTTPKTTYSPRLDASTPRPSTSALAARMTSATSAARQYV
jgi:divalent metal cation (Fe/Co/Zn/Cd) transporter